MKNQEPPQFIPASAEGLAEHEQKLSQHKIEHQTLFLGKVGNNSVWGFLTPENQNNPGVAINQKPNGQVVISLKNLDLAIGLLLHGDFDSLGENRVMAIISLEQVALRNRGMFLVHLGDNVVWGCLPSSLDESPEACFVHPQGGAVGLTLDELVLLRKTMQDHLTAAGFPEAVAPTTPPAEPPAGQA